MKHLAIRIEARDPREVQDALDDVVAAILTGQESGTYDEGGVRIEFSWAERGEADRG